MYKVYIKTDLYGRVVEINSSDFIKDPTGWVLIDEGDGDRFHHAQGNYLEKPLTTMQGIYQYKLVSGKAVERTPEEIAADVALIPPPPPTLEEEVKALKLKLADMDKQATVFAKDIVALKGGKVDKPV